MRLPNQVITDGKTNKPVSIYRHKFDAVQSLGKAILQGNAIDASEYMTHCTIEIRSPLQYPSPVIADRRFAPEYAAPFPDTV